MNPSNLYNLLTLLTENYSILNVYGRGEFLRTGWRSFDSVYDSWTETSTYIIKVKYVNLSIWLKVENFETWAEGKWFILYAKMTIDG